MKNLFPYCDYFQFNAAPSFPQKCIMQFVFIDTVERQLVFWGGGVDKTILSHLSYGAAKKIPLFKLFEIFLR